MKIVVQIFILWLLTLFFSCKQQSGKKDNPSVITDSVSIAYKEKEKKRLEKRMEIEEENRIDSLKFDKVLTDALKIARLNIGKDKFYTKYEVAPDNEYNVKVEINLDHHLIKSHSHLIIRRGRVPGSVCIDIYSKNDNKFEKVISHEQSEMTYVNDTIRDINGDGLKDFVVNWYGSAGCCLKAFSNVYLFRKNKKSFSKGFEFINPTFSAKEKIIRGICYGHPGETAIYKYKWHGEKIDTLEYVSFEKNEEGKKTGKIIISNTYPYNNNFKILKRFNNVPREYKNIYNYSWFTGDIR
jgi:hypothetical protein